MIAYLRKYSAFPAEDFFLIFFLTSLECYLDSNCHRLICIQCTPDSYWRVTPPSAGLSPSHIENSLLRQRTASIQDLLGNGPHQFTVSGTVPA